jgi:putative membrane protein
MKTKSLLAATLLTFLMMQACQNANHKTTEIQSTASDSAMKEDVITDTSGINRGANLNVFMNEAALAGMMEIELGKLAGQKATNPKIKDYAKMIVKDHTKIAEKLKKLANDKKITLPTVLPQADLDHIADLQQMPVNEFEKHYMDMMVKDHIKALDLFKSATTSGDTPLQDFAIGTLRKLEWHYKQAIAIESKIK